MASSVVNAVPKSHSFIVLLLLVVRMLSGFTAIYIKGENKEKGEFYKRIWRFLDKGGFGGRRVRYIWELLNKFTIWVDDLVFGQMRKRYEHLFGIWFHSLQRESDPPSVHFQCVSQISVHLLKYQTKMLTVFKMVQNSQNVSFIIRVLIKFIKKETKSM